MNTTTPSTKHPPQFFISLYGWTYWLPIFLAGLFAVSLFLMLQIYWLVFIFLILTIACLAFYRDFDRPIPTDANIMVAPADGKITEITELSHYAPFNGPALKVSIFLSVLDVHVNRAPCDATVLWTRYEEGLFLDARHPDCSTKNQSNTIALGPPNSTNHESRPTDHAPIAIAQSTDEGFFFKQITPGSTLMDRLQSPIPLTEKEAVGVVSQVTKILKEANRRGVIHGNITPQNIAIEPTGAATLTHTNAIKAKTMGPDYLSPEQIRGEVNIDARSDIYSLGAILYHMLTGRRPFEAPTPAAVMHKNLRDEIVAPKQIVPELSTGVCEVIQVAMAKKKNNRYQSADEMLADLEKISVGESPVIASQILSGRSPESTIPIAILKQIVGAIARRIIAPLTPGESLSRGQRIGMIAFGSRTELYVPANQNWKVVPPLETHIKGGKDILLRKS